VAHAAIEQAQKNPLKECRGRKSENSKGERKEISGSQEEGSGKREEMKEFGETRRGQRPRAVKRLRAKEGEEC